MKNSILLFLAIALSCSNFAHAQYLAGKRANGLLRFVASYPGLRDAGLYTLLMTRCNRYMTSAEKGKCRYAVDEEIRLLDFDVVFEDDRKAIDPQNFVFVAFKTTLIDLLAQESTTSFLDKLQKDLHRYFQQELTHLNIWEMALNHYKSADEAAKVMAVLFQDTTHAKLHLAFLNRTNVKGNALFEKNKALLSRSIDTINLILDYSESSYRELFYPRSIRQTLNRNIYHFYVPLYLARALMRNGIEKKYAYTAPLMLTLTYEFVTAADDFRYLIWDPSDLDPVKHAWKLKDIYGGYSGVSFATKGLSSLVSFEVIKESFARSTEDAVSLLLKY